MISAEPTIKVGICEHARELRGACEGVFALEGFGALSGPFVARAAGGAVAIVDQQGNEVARGTRLHAVPAKGARFVLHDVTIGIQFHWERKEDQRFGGALTFLACDDGTITAINEVALEEYLESVISSEMSAEAPLELLKSHAITSRSWLVAMLEREERNIGVPSQRTVRRENEVIRWYDREDHDRFDVCADDHCQRYHGITKIISAAAAEAVRGTRGVFLVHGNTVCDARFSKACGGISENYATAWEDARIPYLISVSDAETDFPPVENEEDAVAWITARPQAYCNTKDEAILRQILPSFDQETKDFFRWRVDYTQEGMSALLRNKSGIDFGEIRNLTPLQRGPSGRIFRMKVEGTKTSVIVGKELEIRRWLSQSHLYSSAFIVERIQDSTGAVTGFVLQGAGWGHGVGLCQIGAAVMAAKGIPAEAIVSHYFRGAELKTLY
jgi:stage II sporulation protein D